MIILKRLCLAISVLLLLIIGHGIVHSDDILVGIRDEPVLTFLKNEEKRLGGDENVEARVFTQENKSIDGKNKTALLYTIEGIRGGTDWMQYIVVFINDDKVLLPENTILIGGKGIRAIRKIISFTSGVISLSALYYGKTDALCCPSIPGTLKIVRNKGVWQETQVTIDCQNSVQ